MTTQRQIDRLIAIRAAEWYELVRSNAGNVPTEFMEWLESPAHMEAFMAIASDAPAMRAALRSGNFNLEELLQRASSQVIPIEPLRLQSEVRSTSNTSRGRRSRWVWITAAAAGLGLLAVGAGLSALQWQKFDTRLGEQRILQLTDGSVVRLNARSRLEVRMSRHERDLRLTGEALFKVAPDVQRPFRVYTDSATVQAVGTQFNVDEQRDGTTLVSVVEGKVEVSSPVQSGMIPQLIQARNKPKGSTPQPLSTGEQARVARAGRIERASIPDVSAATAWQDRKLIFKHTALEQIVDEFNRYNSIQLRLQDVPQGQFFYSGIFDADNPRALALLLAKEPDLAIEHRTDEVVIRRR